MWYEVHPTPVKGEDGKNLVYVRPKSGQKLTMKQLEDYCERWNMLRYGELSRAFDAFIRVAGRFMAEGFLEYYCIFWRLKSGIDAQLFGCRRTTVWV